MPRSDELKALPSMILLPQESAGSTDCLPSHDGTGSLQAKRLEHEDAIPLDSLSPRERDDILRQICRNAANACTRYTAVLFPDA